MLDDNTPEDRRANRAHHNRSEESTREWPPLDLDKLAKVKALHDGSEHAGERAGALAAMMRIARAAGMSISAALSKLDGVETRRAQEASAAAAFSKMWTDFANTPEQRAFRAEREAERAARRQDALNEHGSEEAVFAETRWERRLREACAPLVELHPKYGHVSYLDGWGTYGSKRTMPASVRAAVSRAYRLPRTVVEAWGEFQHWEHQLDQRCAFDPDYSPWHWIEARGYVIEDLCDGLPAVGIEDLQARVEWLRHVNNLGFSRDVAEDNALIDRLGSDVDRIAGVVNTLRTDIERMGARLREQGSSDRSHVGSVQSGHARRTNADKCSDVLAQLSADPSLSDREIARRAGVSPSTVSAVRKQFR